MTSQKIIISKISFLLVTLLTSSTFAGADKGEKEANNKISASQSAANVATANPPHPEHVKLAGNHMLKLHQDLKRFPTRTEFVKHLEKEMKITEAQAEKIVAEMDID
jgi:hypothetical protein